MIIPEVVKAIVVQQYKSREKLKSSLKYTHKKYYWCPPLKHFDNLEHQKYFCRLASALLCHTKIKRPEDKENLSFKIQTI